MNLVRSQNKPLDAEALCRVKQTQGGVDSHHSQKAQAGDEAERQEPSEVPV